MLVASVYAVAGPVLDAGDQAAVAHTLCNAAGKLQNVIRVGTEGTNVGDRVEGVKVDIDDRAEVPVGADCRALFRADQAGLVS